MKSCLVLVMALGVGQAALAVDYARDIKPILKSKCYACHGAVKKEAGLRLDTALASLQGGTSGRAIVPGNPQESLLWQRVRADKDERMPPEGLPLSAAQLQTLQAWIQEGAPAPHQEPVPNPPTDHWSFQKVRNEAAPLDPDSTHPIDAFVRNGLVMHGLTPSPRTDSLSLVRRMFMDLHGLPPTPADLAHWVPQLEQEPDSVIRLIDHLLASPRYAERWGQHWLDLIRYADTHGFEVNTPRPNAWPYRDYVIQAWNQDRSYQRFVFEQIAGDTCGQESATGFLVAAAALLPGQIGKDEPSIRLARQDALDEIIVGTSASILGLTIGCARCHDHKFDPITQEDYYGLQAFFAGVEYGDRDILDDEYHHRNQEAEALESKIDTISMELQQHEVTAFAGRTVVIDDEDTQRTATLQKKNGHGENPKGKQRGYRQDAGDASHAANLGRGRYTWWDNVAGQDVFTWNPHVQGRFGLWISWGAHGSGVHTRDARYVLDQDGDLETRSDQREIARADQYFLAGQTSGTTEEKPLWSGLQFVGTLEWKESSRLVLRGGETGKGITADAIVLQEACESLEAPPEPRLPRLRPSVLPSMNVDRFPTTLARFVRFAVRETRDNNRHEPCLDELEIFGPDHPQRNLALAQGGARVTSSGNYSETGIHQLKHVHDGRYGNSWSWISNQKGSGWVEVDLVEPQRIHRVVWSRDREGQFKDRLATQYQIEVSLDGQQWQVVASHDDREPLGTPYDVGFSLQRNSGQGQGAINDLLGMVGKLQSLEETRARLRAPRQVFAGVSRKPDPTFVLRRGDPEQRLQAIGPRVPRILDSLHVDEAQDGPRRMALAGWLTSPANPLTARVLVNRVWQYHFGEGLVRTPSDFGLSGAAPSHPELLDWLAAQFMGHDWSIKWLHRSILLSATYQQSSRTRPEAMAIDADNRWLWHFPSRRLPAESIRDSMLQACGRLNLEMGGPGFDFFKSRGGLNGFPPVVQFGPSQLRRMIYAHKIRMERVPVFGAFDCPDAGLATSKRTESTTPLQALNLFNSDFTADCADAFARKLQAECPQGTAEQIDLAFRSTLGRSPTAAQLAEARSVAQRYGLEAVCRVLLNSSQFLYLP
jgi:hypothetical protein